ncbi:MAG: hypothetical protein ACFB9M_09700 [Myxococcota bacterium]
MNATSLPTALLFLLTASCCARGAGSSEASHAQEDQPAHAQPLQPPAEAWVAVGEGTELHPANGRVEVRYERSAQKAYGAAVPFTPEPSFEGLHIELSGQSGTVLLVSLRSRNGAIHSWPTVRAEEEPVNLWLSKDRLSWDRFQNDASPQPFDPTHIQSLSVVDISAFMGGPAGALRFTVGGVFVQATALPVGQDDEPTGAAGEAVFFDALVRGEGHAVQTMRSLRLDVLRNPTSARPQLLLGLAHLWHAAESPAQGPQLLDHLLLASVWFERVSVLDPTESRLPSWRVPTALALAHLLDAPERASAAEGRLKAAFRADPGFHGFAMGLIGWTAAVDSERFREGLRAVRRTAALAASLHSSDPSVQNRPRWPHNREGFLLLAADYERRAGELARALRMLERIEQVPDVDTWPFRSEIDARRDAWNGAAQPPRPTKGWMHPHGCVVCHRA